MSMDEESIEFLWCSGQHSALPLLELVQAVPGPRSKAAWAELTRRERAWRGLGERVAELEDIKKERDDCKDHFEACDRQRLELQAQLDRANGRIEIMHTLRSRMQEQLDRATEPRADDGEPVCTVTVEVVPADAPRLGPEMTLDEAVEFSGGDPDRIRADSLEFEVERLRRLLKPRPMSEAVQPSPFTLNPVDGTMGYICILAEYSGSLDEWALHDDGAHYGWVVADMKEPEDG